MKTDPTFWIQARASGLVAYLLLTCSVLGGLVLKSRPFGKALKPPAVLDLHRFLALLALGATALHGLTLVLDQSITITWLDLLVPGTLPYRPVWTGIGVVAAELMLLVYVSFSQRKRIGQKNWRRLHWAAYGVFGAMTVHGVMSGTDTRQPWVLGVYVGAIGAVVTATAFRALVRPSSPERRRRELATDQG